MPEDRCEGYWRDVEVVYYQYYAYEEILATFGDKPGSAISILASLERLTRYLSRGEVDRLASPPEFERQVVLARYSLWSGPGGLAENALELRPELRPVYEESLATANRWSNAEYNDTYLLDARLVSQLTGEPRLLSLLMEHAVFRRFLDKSLAVMRHNDRRARLLTILVKLSRHQLEGLLRQVKINASDLEDLSAPTPQTAEEIVRLVEQRGAGEFDGLEKAIREIVAPVEENQVGLGLAGPAALRAGQIGIVPKGLRSFDEHDSDFFLQLLPGARDKEGLPESIRFWKHRIESCDDPSFTVGVIFGPSGCGKSSLVRAGLLPRLATRVVSVYVGATPGETEARIRTGLQKKLPDLDARLDLTDTITALRHGRGLGPDQKVLIVVDQFEQWLHARRGEQETDLARALRQCDGEHVQCLVMVRDDFWVSLARFMGELRIEILQGQNAALVDLFDLIHARKVLIEFGRAFGCLPESDGTFTKDQEAFLRMRSRDLPKTVG